MSTFYPFATRSKSEAGRGFGAQARTREHRDAAVLLADQELDFRAAEDDAFDALVGEIDDDLAVFAAPGGLPAGVTGAAGSATASPSVAKGIERNPKNWYTKLHTATFPDGAVRGQLSKGGW
ncbi:CHRD domain-containing protein [Nonomuraea africana]|uniref:CHRD domain-containing protein n=1 Tax=Nonomuraea africana TaxID=46171 RepID=A0ABR9KKM7_9ACTN|nr:CHRD domain-containing protein [Nonomuraea africana]MBE1562107.1 hypothetical protein [Nonomuraea africana]